MRPPHAALLALLALSFTHGVVPDELAPSPEVGEGRLFLEIPGEEGIELVFHEPVEIALEGESGANDGESSEPTKRESVANVTEPSAVAAEGESDYDQEVIDEFNELEEEFSINCSLLRGKEATGGQCQKVIGVDCETFPIYLDELVDTFANWVLPETNITGVSSLEDARLKSSDSLLVDRRNLCDKQGISIAGEEIYQKTEVQVLDALGFICFHRDERKKPSSCGSSDATEVLAAAIATRIERAAGVVGMGGDDESGWCEDDLRNVSSKLALAIEEFADVVCLQSPQGEGTIFKGEIPEVLYNIFHPALSAALENSVVPVCNESAAIGSSRCSQNLSAASQGAEQSDSTDTNQEQTIEPTARSNPLSANSDNSTNDDAEIHKIGECFDLEDDLERLRCALEVQEPGG